VTVETALPPDDLAGMAGVHELATAGGHISFTVDGEHLDSVMRSLSALGIRSLVSRPPTLAQLFLRHYAGTAGEGAT
jgi:ABC-2 type transport system ATP-binding protein